jgi:hypothetical protein
LAASPKKSQPGLAHRSSTVIQRRHSRGNFAHFSPAEVERSNKTYAQATIDGVPLKNPEDNSKVFINSGRRHAEIKVIDAFEASRPSNGPTLLSIRINRVPCKPCAEAIIRLLNKYPKLAVRIKATAITRAGHAGLTLLNGHDRAFFRYWTIDELNEKELTFKNRTVTNTTAVVWQQFTSWVSEQAGRKAKRVLGKIDEILKAKKSPSAKAKNIKDYLTKELTGASDRTIRNYTDGVIRTLYRNYKDSALKPHEGGWESKGWTRDEIISALDTA